MTDILEWLTRQRDACATARTRAAEDSDSLSLGLADDAARNLYAAIQEITTLRVRLRHMSEVLQQRMLLEVSNRRWEPAEDQPIGGWYVTARMGERGWNITMRLTPDEWSDSEGRTTVTHSTFAKPTHFLHIEIPTPPKAVVVPEREVH